MTDIADPAAARERALKSLAMPLGLANPLWLAFGAAAGAGACWWLLTRLANPFNAEALFAGAAPAKAALKAVTPVAQAVTEAAPARPVDKRTPETTPVLLQVALDVTPALVEAAKAPVEAALESAQQAVETGEAMLSEAAALAEAEAEDHVAVVEAAVEPVVESADEIEDDLTRLVGVGPRTARALIDRGVTRFAHLAAWTEDQMAAFDHELNLKGRSVRDAWQAQAKRLATEG
jgi:predicted flap endonuclease-1-like 5' DNA nuclease